MLVSTYIKISTINKVDPPHDCEIWRKLHLNLFKKVTMKRNILHIHLKQQPMMNGNNSDDQLKSDMLCSREESILIVNPFQLTIPFGHKSSNNN